jgi:hypothetical protein
MARSVPHHRTGSIDPPTHDRRGSVRGRWSPLHPCRKTPADALMRRILGVQSARRRGSPRKSVSDLASRQGDTPHSTARLHSAWTRPAPGWHAQTQAQSGSGANEHRLQSSTAHGLANTSAECASSAIAWLGLRDPAWGRSDCATPQPIDSGLARRVDEPLQAVTDAVGGCRGPSQAPGLTARVAVRSISIH